MANIMFSKQWGKFHTTSNKMIISFSLLFIVMMILVGAITYRYVARNLEERIIIDNQKIMDQTMVNVDYYFTDVKTPMIMMARNSTVLRSLRTYTEANWPERVAMKRSLEDYTRNINLFKSYIQDIILVGRNGFSYNINTADEIAMNYDFFNSEWLREIIAENEQGISFVKTYKSDYYLGTLKNQTVVSAVLNVRENLQDLGYVICNLDLKQFKDIFEPLSQSNGGVIYMVDNEGEVIFHPESAKAGSRLDRSFMENINLNREGSGSFLFRKGEQTDLIMYAQSKVTGWYLVSSVPYDTVTESAREIRQIVYSLLAGSIVLVVIISYLISIQITRPIKRLFERMKNVQSLDFNAKKTDYGKGEIAIIGQKFEHMVMEINTLIQDVYVSNLKQREAELKELQSRINPHFLYNTLQLVKAEAVFGNNREVSAIVTSLGEMLRYPMYNLDAPVSLEEELNYVRYYLEIYSRRFKGKLQYEIQVADRWLTCTMPKLVLQPIVENCIIHGFENMSRSGTILITADGDDDRFSIVIRDNGQGMAASSLKMLQQQLSGQAPAEPKESSKASDKSGIGLSNVNERIKLKFGSEHGIFLDSSEGEWTEVRIDLPFQH